MSQDKDVMGVSKCCMPDTCEIRQLLNSKIADLENRVAIDALTGLWNRAQFD